MNKKTKILVIDDSTSVRATLRSMLPNSTEVIEAANGLEGLKQVQAHRPNLILLDCQMPEMDGVEVFRRLQKHPHFRRIPVVLMSARPDEVLPQLEQQAHAFEFLSKPFKPAQLLKASHEAMKQAKGMKAAAASGATAPSVQASSATAASQTPTQTAVKPIPNSDEQADTPPIEIPLQTMVETLQRDMKVMQTRCRLLEAELKQVRQLVQERSGV